MWAGTNTLNMSYWYRDPNVLNSIFLDFSLNSLTHLIVNPQGPDTTETGGVQQMKFQVLRTGSLLHIVF